MNVTSFGAVCDGVTDDTAAIQAALDYAAGNNGGVVRFPAAKIKLVGRIIVADQVDLLGAGMTATTILCASSGSGVAFSDNLTHTPNPRRGRSGHFNVQGANVALNPVSMGYQTACLFERIKVTGAADVGIKIAEVQNSSFVGLEVSGSGNTNMTIDLTSRTLGFYDCILSGAGNAGLRILQSAMPLNAGGPRCSKLHFSGGLIEGVANGPAILIEAGTDILFDAMKTSGSGVRLVRANNQQVQRITLRHLELQAATKGIGLEVKGGLASDPIQVYLESGVLFSSGACAIETDDAALIHATDYVQAPEVPTFWRNSGTLPMDRVVRDLGKRQSALTPANINAVDATYGAEEAAVIQSLRARLNEMEARLKNSGLLNP